MTASTTTTTTRTSSSSTTPQAEIDKQHETIARLLQQGLLFQPTFCGDNNYNGREIPLSYKTCPTDMLHDTLTLQEKDVFPLWSSRAVNVDVSALQELVREGYDTIYKQLPLHKTSKKRTTSAAKSLSSKEEKAPNNKLDTQQSATTTNMTNLWDPVNASIHNVHMCRPSHDAWGIGKIVLVFSDDFLQQRLHMPWWWSGLPEQEQPQKNVHPSSLVNNNNKMRQAVQPILDALQIPEERIARMLLASLPPGVTIPIHHDSGEWVKHTHRIHVPVLVQDPEQIVFSVGFGSSSSVVTEADATDDSNNNNPYDGVCMHRIDCRPGHVFEINNQAKHAVSNCSPDSRVHLILDYVDANYEWPKPDIIRLQPGQVVVQTRRSVDLLTHKGSRPTPSFMILGAQKAGTTSLYEKIMQHPLAVRPKRRETHCLDWRWNDELTCVEKQREWCLQFYRAQALAYHPSCLTGDSTPSYLLDSRRVIPRLQAVFAHRIQFFVLCREPIQRAESHFAMVTSKHGTAAQLQTRGSEWRQKTLAQVVQDELHILKQCGLLPHWNVETGVCDATVFEEFAGSPREDEAWQRYLENHVPLNTGSYGLLSRGLYELQLRPWLRGFEGSQFVVLLLEDFQGENEGVVTNTMQKVWKHLGLPPIDDHMEDNTPKNQREYQNQMDERLKQYLEAFYAPYNRRLQMLLDQHGWGSKNVMETWMHEK